MKRTVTLSPLGTTLLLLGLPLVAQIQGPQLGLLSRNGEVRRMEGLSLSSRLSSPVELGVACSRVSAAPGAAMRWALCATDDSSLLIDLSGAIAPRKISETPYASATWSANGKALLVDGMRVTALDEDDLKIEAARNTARAISDAGTVAEDDSVLAYDNEAALSVRESALHRLEAGKAEEIYTLAFAPAFVAGSNDSSLFAAAGQRLARISRTSGDIAYFDLPVEASTLRLLSDGSVLIAEPAPGEPGWLFRWTGDGGGSFHFVPGIPVDQTAVEVRQ